MCAGNVDVQGPYAGLHPVTKGSEFQDRKLSSGTFPKFHAVRDWQSESNSTQVLKHEKRTSLSLFLRNAEDSYNLSLGPRPKVCCYTTTANLVLPYRRGKIESELGCDAFRSRSPCSPNKR